ncbi:MAG: sacsin N-terminal ATP-binding-like domain-containing protein [Pseudonocardiaceae bacterium]
MTPDPFGTAALRDGVLAAWRSSPTRFREDANAESDLVRGGYADRLLVELAQNAADAAQRAGTPGRLRIVVAGGELCAANTGTALDRDGVAALAALRASAKRNGTAVGRFGVGFAAVLAVSDAPRVVSRTGAVGFSAERTAAAVAGDPALVAELDRRKGRPPVLRLPWPVEEPPPPAGFDTEVRLPLRDGVDVAALLTECAAQAPDLLLALPWLERIDVADDTYRREDADPVLLHAPEGTTRWRLVRRSGRFTSDELAALSPEAHEGWTVCWALPVDADGTPLPLGEDVLHAPTRTAERLTLPARLIAEVPVEASRRHVQAGPAADAVIAAAVAAYPALTAVVGPLDRTVLVPDAAFPAGALDAALRSGVLDALRTAPWLPSPAGDLAPQRARVLDVVLPDLAAVLADVDTGLVDAELAAPRHVAALAALGVARLGAAAVVELLGGLQRPPAWWYRCYTAIAPLLDADPAAREELGALPVPLFDGRTVTGPRGVLLGADAVGAIVVPDLRLAHPDAVHPLLERLGARPAGPTELLDALRPAVERSVDDAEDGLDVAPLREAVPALAARVDAPPGWLGALALPDEAGDPRRADELLLPDAALRAVLAADAPLGVVGVTEPRDGLLAVGVLDTFAVVQDDAPAGPDHDLDDEDAWWDTVADDPPALLLAVRDLDFVDADAWPAALRLLAAQPRTLTALRAPGGYVGWWLARHARLGDRPPRHWRLPGASVLVGLFDPVPVDLPADLLAAAGVRAGLEIDGPADAVALLDRLGDRGRTVTPAVVHAAHAALAAAGLDADDVDPPSRVRARTGEVVDAERALVLDAPWFAAVLPAEELVSGGDASALAELLDLPLASEAGPGEVLGDGRRCAWGDLVDVVAACAAAGLAIPDGDLVVHSAVRVRVAGAEHEVPYWVTASGVVHAADPVRALLGVANRSGPLRA